MMEITNNFDTEELLDGSGFICRSCIEKNNLLDGYLDVPLPRGCEFCNRLSGCVPTGYVKLLLTTKGE